MTATIEEAQKLLETGCYQLAKDNFIEILKTEPQNVKALYGLGLSYIPLQQFEKSYLNLQKAYAIEKTNPILLHDLANIARKLQKPHDAKVFYERAIELSPRFAEAFAGLATIFEMLGEPIKAEEAYNRALALDPDLPEVLYNLGKLLLREGELDRAAKHFIHLLRMYPDNILARFHMGLIAYEKSEWEKARDYFLEVLQYRPHDIEALNNLGVISLKLENSQQAIHFFGQVLALQPSHRDARENIAATFMQNNRFDNAIIHYEEMLQLYPDYFQGQFNLACAYMTIGDFKKAKKHFNALLEVSNNNPDVLANMGLMAQQEGDHKLAQSYYEQVIQHDPNNVVIQHMYDALQGKDKDDAPAAYVKHLFDHYAFYYDKHLQESLAYAVPEQFKTACQELKIFYELGLDLGCGTGLSGELVKPFGRKLIGVDISEKMLSIAKGKMIYDELICDDVHQYLENTSNKFDAFFAADVLNYVGNLRKLFSLIKNHMQDKSYFVFTFESDNKSAIHLNPTGRFSHLLDYVEEVLKEVGLQLQSSKAIDLRNQQGKPVKGYLVVSSFGL